MLLKDVRIRGYRTLLHADADGGFVFTIQYSRRFSDQSLPQQRVFNRKMPSFCVDILDVIDETNCAGTPMEA